MSGGETGFVVVIGRQEDWRPMELAPVLAEFRGVPSVDVAREIRRARGVFTVEAGEAEAARLAGALKAAGYSASVAPASLLRPLPEARLLRYALPADDAFGVRFRDGSEQRIPWDRLRLAAFASFNTHAIREVEEEKGPGPGQLALGLAVTGVSIATGVGPFFFPMGTRENTVRTVTKTDNHLLLDLLLRDPGERVRVDASRFDFSGLGGDMTYNALANMRILLAHIVHRADTAATSPGANLLLEGGRLSSLGFDSVEDLEREERWLVAILPA